MDGTWKGLGRHNDNVKDLDFYLILDIGSLESVCEQQYFDYHVCHFFSEVLSG